MTNTNSQPENLSFRKQLIAAFSIEELNSFCFDYFRSIYEEFTLDITKPRMVQLLLEYCVRRKRVPELLDLLERERPGIVKDRTVVFDSLMKLSQLNEDSYTTTTRDSEALPSHASTFSSISGLSHPMEKSSSRIIGGPISISGSTIQGDVTSGTVHKHVSYAAQQPNTQMVSATLEQTIAAVRREVTLLPLTSQLHASAYLTLLETALNAHSLDLALLESAVHWFRQASTSATIAINAVLRHPTLRQHIGAAGLTEEFTRRFGR